MAADESRPEPPSKKRKKGIPCLDINGPDHLHSFYLFAEMDKWSDDCVQKILQLSKATDTHGLEVCRVLHRTVLYYKVMERDIAAANAYEREQEAQASRLAVLTNKNSTSNHDPHDSTLSVSRLDEGVERRESVEVSNGKSAERNGLEGGQKSIPPMAETGQHIKFIVTGLDGAMPTPTGKTTVVQPIENVGTQMDSSEQNGHDNERMQREPSLIVVRRVVPRNPPPVPPVRQCKIELREGEEERTEAAATTTDSSAESTSRHDQLVIAQDEETETENETPTIRIKQETSETRLSVSVDSSTVLREMTPPPLVIKRDPGTPPPGPSVPNNSVTQSSEKRKKKKKKTTTGSATVVSPMPHSSPSIPSASSITTPPSYSLPPSTAVASIIGHSPSFSFNASTVAAAASFTPPSRLAAYNTASAFITSPASFSSPSSATTAADQSSFGASHVGIERVTLQQLADLLEELSKHILQVNTIKEEAIKEGVHLGHLSIPLKPVSYDSRGLSIDIFNCECRRVADEVRSLDMKFDSLHMPTDGYLRVSSHKVRREIDRIWKIGRGEGDVEHTRWTDMTTHVQKTTTSQGIDNAAAKILKMFNCDTEPAAKPAAEKRCRPDSILPAERDVPHKKRRLNERKEREGRERREGREGRDKEDEPSTSRGDRHKDTEERTWCAFCKTKTSHSAINCSVYKTHDQRQERLRELKICFHCLDRYDPVSCKRKEHMRSCTHCGLHTSHPALCKFLNRPPNRASRISPLKSRKGRNK